MGALTLIQSGFFSAPTSGRCAFSGWRGLLVASSTTVMAAPRLTYGRRTAGARRPVLASARHIAREATELASWPPIPYQGKARLHRSNLGIFLTDRFAPILLSSHF